MMSFKKQIIPMLAGSALALCVTAPASADGLLGGTLDAVGSAVGGVTDSLSGGGRSGGGGSGGGGTSGGTSIDAGVASVSVGQRSGGLGVDVGVNGGDTANGQVKTTLFGSNGILSTGGNVNALNDDVTLNSNTTALSNDSLLDTQNDVSLLGTSGNVDATVGGGTGVLGLVDPNVCIGTDCNGGSGGPGGGSGNGGGVGGNGDILKNMSSAELMRYKKTCRSILGNPGGFDASLVQLCRMIAQAG